MGDIEESMSAIRARIAALRASPFRKPPKPKPLPLDEIMAMVEKCLNEKESASRAFSQALRRDRLAENGGKGVKKAEWLEILEYHGNRCAYCLVQSDSLQMDHVQPVAGGGRHEPENIVPACARCNSSKSDWSLIEVIMRDRLLVREMMFET